MRSADRRRQIEGILGYRVVRVGPGSYQIQHLHENNEKIVLRVAPANHQMYQMYRMLLVPENQWLNLEGEGRS